MVVLKEMSFYQASNLPHFFTPVSKKEKKTTEEDYEATKMQNSKKKTLKISIENLLI